MSICSIPRSTIPRSAAAWCAPSIADWASRSALCCRSSRGTRKRANGAGRPRRSSAAAWQSGLGQSRRVSVHQSARPDAGSAAAADAGRTRASAHAESAGVARGAASLRAGREFRHPVRVHAAGIAARGLSRAARGDRAQRQGDGLPGSYRRLSAAARSAPQRHQGDARSRRARSQRPSRAELARGCRDDDVAL